MITSPNNMSGLMEMFSGNTTPRRNFDKPGPYEPLSKPGGGGFWDWLEAQGMPPAMLAAIRQDPNLQANYFQQFKAEQDAKKPQNPSIGMSFTGGGDMGPGKEPGWEAKARRQSGELPGGYRKG